MATVTCFARRLGSDLAAMPGVSLLAGSAFAAGSLGCVTRLGIALGGGELEV